MSGFTNVNLSKVQFSRGIPRLLHQVCLGRGMPKELVANTKNIAEMNADYTYSLYDDDRAEAFLLDHYGSAVLDIFRGISPDYGAAKADLLRYALLYRLGGVYLDLKSSMDRPLREVLLPSDSFIVSQWDNGPGAPFEGWGLHDEVSDIPRGEFQQWHVISSPGHPFLAAILKAVLKNLATYRPWVQGTGQPGVLRTTGPVPYTKAITSLSGLYPHRLIQSEREIGFVFSIFGSANTKHIELFPRSYHHSADYIVQPKGPLQRRLWLLRMRYERSNKVYQMRESRNSMLRELGFDVQDRQTRRFS